MKLTIAEIQQLSTDARRLHEFASEQLKSMSPVERREKSTPELVTSAMRLEQFADRLMGIDVTIKAAG